MDLQKNIILKVNSEIDAGNVLELLAKIDSSIEAIKTKSGNLTFDGGKDAVDNLKKLQAEMDNLKNRNSELVEQTKIQTDVNLKLKSSVNDLEAGLKKYKSTIADGKEEKSQVAALKDLQNAASNVRTEMEKEIKGNGADKSIQGAKDLLLIRQNLLKAEKALSVEKAKATQIDKQLQILEKKRQDSILKLTKQKSASFTNQQNAAITEDPVKKKEYNDLIKKETVEIERQSKIVDQQTQEVNDLVKAQKEVSSEVENISSTYENLEDELSSFSLDPFSQEIQKIDDEIYKLSLNIKETAKFDLLSDELLNPDEIDPLIKKMQELIDKRDELEGKQKKREINLIDGAEGDDSIGGTIESLGGLKDAVGDLGENLGKGDVKGAFAGVSKFIKGLPPQAKIAAAAIIALSTPFVAFFARLQDGKDKFAIFSAGLKGLGDQVVVNLGKIGRSFANFELPDSFNIFSGGQGAINRESLYASQLIDLEKLNLKINEFDQANLARQERILDLEGSSRDERIKALNEINDIELKLIDDKLNAAVFAEESLRKKIEDSDEPNRDDLSALNKVIEERQSIEAQKIKLDSSTRDRITANLIKSLDDDFAQEEANLVRTVLLKEKEAILIQKAQAAIDIEKLKTQRIYSKISEEEYFRSTQKILQLQRELNIDLASLEAKRELDLGNAAILEQTFSYTIALEEIEQAQIDFDRGSALRQKKRGELTQEAYDLEVQNINRRQRALTEGIADRALAVKAALRDTAIILSNSESTGGFVSLSSASKDLQLSLSGVRAELARIDKAIKEVKGSQEEIDIFNKDRVAAEKQEKSLLRELDIQETNDRLRISKTLAANLIFNTEARENAISMIEVQAQINSAERIKAAKKSTSLEYQEATAQLIQLAEERARLLVESQAIDNNRSRRETAAGEDSGTESRLGGARGNPFIDSLREEQEAFNDLFQEKRRLTDEIIKIDKKRFASIEALQDPVLGLTTGQIASRTAEINREADVEKTEVQTQSSRVDNEITEAQRGRTLLGRILGIDRADEDQAALEDALSAALDTTQQFITEYLSMQVKKVNEDIAIQESRVERANNLFQRGNAEALNREEARLDQLLEAREKAVKKERAFAAIQQATNTALTISNLLTGLAASGSTGNPVQIAAYVVAAVAGLAAVGSLVSAFTDVPAFFEGTDTDVQTDAKGNKFSSGRDGYMFRGDGTEKVLAGKHAKRVRHMSQLDLVENALAHEKSIREDQMAYLPPIVAPETDSGLMTYLSGERKRVEASRIAKENRDIKREYRLLRESIEGIGMTMTVDSEGFFMGFEKKVNTHKKMRRMRSSL